VTVSDVVHPVYLSKKKSLLGLVALGEFNLYLVFQSLGYERSR